MFPGTNFQPPHYHIKIGASTVPESSGGDANYNAQSPVPSGITKLHWRRDYADGGAWTETAHPGYENPDSYSSDGYLGWSHNALTNKFAKDVGLGTGSVLYSVVGTSNFIAPGTYVIEIPEDVAMGSKPMARNIYNQLWYCDPAVHMGNFPPGSTVIIHNYGIIAGAGGTGGRGGGVYVSGTPNNDALGGGGGGGAGLHDWELPFEKHEQGDNFGLYPLDSNKNAGQGPMPDLCFPGSGGTPTMQITVFNGNEAANGFFGPGNVAATDNSQGGGGSLGPTGITFAGVPVLSGGAASATQGNIGGSAFHTTGQNGIFWIYNHSTGRILGGGGGGGGGAGVANAEGDGGDGGDPGEAGVAGGTASGTAGGAAGAAGVVFEHNGFWDAAGATQSKFIIKQNDGTIKGNEGDNSAFGVGTEH